MRVFHAAEIGMQNVSISQEEINYMQIFWSNKCSQSFAKQIFIRQQHDSVLEVVFMLYALFHLTAQPYICGLYWQKFSIKNQSTGLKKYLGVKLLERFRDILQTWPFNFCKQKIWTKNNPEFTVYSLAISTIVSK